MRAGMNVARLNFSHESPEDHLVVMQRLRSVAERLSAPIGILQDLQGPKIRVGKLDSGRMELVEGSEAILTADVVQAGTDEIPVDFPDLPHYVRPGQRILLDDGQLELVVIGVEGPRIRAQVVLGGELSSKKGVNLPGVRLDLPCLTSKDVRDLSFGLEYGVDAVAISFVRSGADVRNVRETIKRLAPGRSRIPIIAKLERAEALQNLDEIVQEADGLMVARGDLGVEMSPEAVPTAQKKIIEAANLHMRLVITATQMLESMIRKPRPTRAEATDVANAIFDGTDAVMLSGETAVGRYPIKSVQTMDAVIREAETHLSEWGRWSGAGESATQDDAVSITRAAADLARDRNVAAIAVFTRSGRTAILMSKARPIVPILAFTPEPETYRRLSLYWGVTPHLCEPANTVEEMLIEVEKAILADHLIRPREQVILIAGYPVGSGRPPNLALLYTLGEK